MNYIHLHLLISLVSTWSRSRTSTCIMEYLLCFLPYKMCFNYSFLLVFRTVYIFVWVPLAPCLFSSDVGSLVVVFHNILCLSRSTDTIWNELILFSLSFFPVSSFLVASFSLHPNISHLDIIFPPLFLSHTDCSVLTISSPAPPAPTPQSSLGRKFIL